MLADEFYEDLVGEKIFAELTRATAPVEKAAAARIRGSEVAPTMVAAAIFLRSRGGSLTNLAAALGMIASLPRSWAALRPALDIHFGRHEASYPELLAMIEPSWASTKKFKARKAIRALEEFRRELAEGLIDVGRLDASGGYHSLSHEDRKIFLSDNGRGLCLTGRLGSHRLLWDTKNLRGDLYVDLRGRHAKSSIHSGILLALSDAHFTIYEEWILHAGRGEGIEATLKNSLKILEELRRHKDATGTVPNLDKTIQEERLIAASRAEKLHSGNYDTFEQALQKLPWEEFPEIC